MLLLTLESPVVDDAANVTEERCVDRTAAELDRRFAVGKWHKHLEILEEKLLLVLRVEVVAFADFALAVASNEASALQVDEDEK